MLSPAQLASFQTNGFVKGSKVLTDDQIERLRSETLRVIDDRDRKDLPQPVLCRNLSQPSSPVWQIVNIWQASPPFKDLIAHPTITEEIAQLHNNARELRIWHDQIQYKPAGVGGVNMWHQDAPYWDVLTPKDQQVTAWVALDDVDEGNGCMSMVPGSHLWGNQINFLHTLKNYDDMRKVGEFEGRKVDVVLCPVKKGEVHYHHSLTWHGSHANTSNRPRRAVALHYMTEQTRYLAKGSHPMKPFVESKDGETVKGPAFPVVYARKPRPALA